MSKYDATDIRFLDQKGYTNKKRTKSITLNHISPNTKSNGFEGTSERRY